MTPDLAWWWRLAAFLAAQTALIVGAATLVNYIIRAPRVRRAMWQAALIAMACVWLGETAGLGEKVRGLWPREKTEIVQTEAPFATVTKSSAATGRVERPLLVHREAPATPVTWPGKLWLLGTLLLLLRAVANRGWLAWQRRQMGFADIGTQATVARLRAALGLRGVETRTWARLRGPIAFGWWRPTVAVPADFSLRFTSEQREAMFAHELAHLAGCDPLWLTLADTVCALAWWNPLAWWAAMQLRDASEAVADEASALVPSGPSALAESLFRFGRELAESGLARGLGVAGIGFRSGLGRRVTALLTSPVKWRELPARWRWAPIILALAFVLTMTSAPILPGPPGSIFGLIVQPGQAQPARPLTQSVILSNDWFTNGVIEESNSPPIIAPAVASNGTSPEKVVVLVFKMAGIREGSTAQAAFDKLFNHLPPDEAAGPDVVAQFLHEAKISHTSNLHIDYLINENEAVTLSPAQFKATLDGFERDKTCNIASSLKVTTPSGRQAYVAAEGNITFATGVKRTDHSPTGGATNDYLTDDMKIGVSARVLPTVSAEGWNLSILSRTVEFLGYDKPGRPEKDCILPLPHIRVNEIHGQRIVRLGDTLALRGPAHTATNKVTDTVLGVFHSTHTEIVTTRNYLFVTPISETK